MAAAALSVVNMSSAPHTRQSGPPPLEHLKNRPDIHAVSHCLAALLAHQDSRLSQVLDQYTDALSAAFSEQFPTLDRCIRRFEFGMALTTLQDATPISPDQIESAWKYLVSEQDVSILVIDDTPSNLAVMSRILNSDWRVMVASNGETGLKIACSDTPPALIVLDIMMPGMDGYEVIHLLKSNPATKNIPVVFYTAHSDAAFEKKALELGAADYITKPLNPAIAHQRIRNLLEREGLRKEVECYRDSLSALVSERSLQLRDRMAQITTIFKLSPDGFVSFDRSNCVSSASPAFYRLTGLDEADIAGLDESKFSALLARHCPQGSSFPGFAQLRAAPAQHHRMEWLGASRLVLELVLHTNSIGTISHILHVRDVSHETEVDHLKREFLHSAAHELRTPMTSLYGFAELLMSEELDQARRQEFLGIIVKQSKQMMGITNDLVDLDRIATRQGRDFDFKVRDLGTFLRDTLQQLPSPEGRELPLAQYPEGAMPVRMDADKLKQALAGLLSNAWKYSRPGTAVSIRCLSSMEHGVPMVGIEVRDQGAGMTPAQVAQCCDRFYRADGSGQLAGAGLGLSLSKEIMHLHGGKLGIRSEPGQGTTATLWLEQIQNDAYRHTAI